MAKQVGLFGLRGKIENKSFYKTTGVVDTIIRGIPEGLSERVKTSEEYANTRLNNKEFGAACNTAGLLGKMVVPKFRPMFLPFSQSRIAKDILKLARQNSEIWGQRTIESTQVEQVAAVLSAQSKRDATEFVSCGVTRSSATSGTASIEYTNDQATLMNGLGIDELTVYASIYDLASGKWNDVVGEMSTGYIHLNEKVAVLDASSVSAGTGESHSESLTIAPFVPAPNHSGMQIVVFVIIPARVINNTSHVLQEYCSFTAMPLPAND